MENEVAAPAAMLAGHGAAELAAVTVDTYNAELRDPDGFIGDRASKRAFQSILDDWRDKRPSGAGDPLGDQASADISKKKLDRLLTGGDIAAAAVIHSAIEDFAQELARVIRRFLRLKAWRDTQRIVIGGGLRASRVGELAIGRAGVLLHAENSDAPELAPIRHHPDEAGLIGAAHMTPSWIFSGHDSILAADIGGTNMRAGVVELNLRKAPDLSKAHVMDFELWRHRDDQPSRDEATARLGEMLKSLAKRALKQGHKLAPFVGIGCPGIIADDGTIARGGQNLPGDWEGDGFSLPTCVRAMLPEIDGHRTVVLMHNDAVVQGLSEVPFQRDVDRWGVLTMGTGLGNARFTRHDSPPPER
jgi:predicted NBD/HSP70 family sugar kinase